jgi:hypothetical protein
VVSAIRTAEEEPDKVHTEAPDASVDAASAADEPTEQDRGES